jgi:hypothetical protein
MLMSETAEGHIENPTRKPAPHRGQNNLKTKEGLVSSRQFHLQFRDVSNQPKLQGIGLYILQSRTSNLGAGS